MVNVGVVGKTWAALRHAGVASVLASTCLILPAPAWAGDFQAETEHRGNVQQAATATPTAPPFHVSNGVSRFLQTYSGLNWISEKAAGATAGAFFSRKTHGKVHVKIKSYGFTDLLNGEFKSVELNARDGYFKGVPYGRIHVLTSSPFKVRFFKGKNKQARRGLQAPLLVAIDGQIGEKDLSKALKSPKVTDGLRFLKFDLPGLGSQRLRIQDPHVDLLGDRIAVDSYLITDGGAPDTGIQLRVLAHPQLEKERYIKLLNMEVESKDMRNPQFFGPFAEQLFNPLVDFGRYDRLTHAFRMDKLEIDKERINYAGRLLLAPKPMK
jgi:LmeA-like phospholipid-binding